MKKRLFLFFTFIIALVSNLKAQVYGNEWINYSQQYYRFEIIQSGIHKIEQSTLLNAGIPLSTISPDNFQVFGREKEIPIFIELNGDATFDAGDYIAFYAEMNDGWLDSILYQVPGSQGNPKYSLYNDTINYFFTWNNSTNNLRFTIETDVDFASYTPSTHVLSESSVFYNVLYNEGEKSSDASSSFFTPGEGWGNWMYNGAGNYTLNLSTLTPNVYNGVDASLCRYKSVSVSNSNASYTGLGNHHLNYKIGGSGHLLVDTIFSGYKAINIDETFPSSVLSSGSTPITWSILGDQGAITDYQSLNYWSLWYPRMLDFSNVNQAKFKVLNNQFESKIRLDISNLSYSNPFVFVFGTTPRKITITNNSGTHQMLIPNDVVNEQLLVFQDVSTIINVSSVLPVNGNGLFTNYASLNANDAILMVYHSSLETSTNEYVSYRQSLAGGQHNVIKANIDDLYLQFGGGIEKHICGIRRFAHFMNDQATSKPKSLFLIGKGIREANINGVSVSGPGTRKNPANFAKSLVPSFGQPSSDVFITSNLPGTTMWTPLIPTGRISVATNEELHNYLEKVKLYEIQQDTNSVYNSANKDWQKQLLHFVGGSDANQQQMFQSYMNTMKFTIENKHFAGNVTTLAKDNNIPFSPSDLDMVMNRITDGVSIINYFGHAALTESGFEINIDNPHNWNNYGKYPIIISNSCYNGNIFQSTKSKSEEFVDLADFGAIAFIGTVNLGFSNTLFLYTNELYNQMSLMSYGQTLSAQMKSTISAMEQLGNSLFLESNTAQMALNGDPMVKLNWHQRPEIELVPEYVSFQPQNIDLTTDSIEIIVDLKNLGRSVLDTFSLEVKRNFPNSNDDSLYQFYVPGMNYKTSHSFKVPLQPSIGVGLNQFDIKVDLPTFVDEQYEEIANNQIVKTLFINVAGIVPVIPFDYAVVPIDSVTVKASTIDPIAPMNSYRFELDTTDLYNSPFKKYCIVNGLGGVKEVHPSQWLSAQTNMSSPLVCTDSTVYFWRVSINQVDTFWTEHSFQYIPGKEGWGQDHFFQFKKNSHNDLKYDRTQRLKEFLPQSHIVTNDVRAASSIPDIYYNSYYIDGNQKEYGICTYTPSIHVAVIDPLTLVPWATRYGAVNPTHNFGNANDNGACRNRPEKYFIFRQTDATQLANFSNMVLNQVPDGHYLLIYTPITARFDLWDGIDPTVYNTFATLGSDSIFAGRPNMPFSFFVKKGDPSSAKEQIGQYAGQNLLLSANIDGYNYKGNEVSTLIGPAAQWDAMFWKQDPLEVSSEDTTTLRIQGLSIEQNILFDSTIVFSLNDSLLNLSNMLDAQQYPYLRLTAFYEDSVTFTPAQMDYWHVLYQPLPEAAIDGTTAYTWISAADTVAEGDSITFAVDVKNIFTIPMDSILINYWVTTENQAFIPIAYPRQDSLLVNETFRDTITFSTLNMGGLNTFWMEVNPYVNGSLYITDQAEQKHFNNLLQIPFSVKRDDINPILDVTFNGRHILNNDIVSPESEILITLKDENPFLVMNSDADTSLFGIYVTDPDGIITKIPFIDGNGNTVMQWIPAETQLKKFKIIYPAMFTKDGTYKLLVQGSDKSSNLSGDIEYRIEFKVVHESMITEMMNYPNPFSTSTRFVFTLTGSEVPDEVQIQIMTVSGRVVREITEDELGPINIGRNISQYAWDGKDQFGDPLANGVYLYRVKAQINGEDIKHLESGADAHFKKGFGKMYLMR